MRLKQPISPPPQSGPEDRVHGDESQHGPSGGPFQPVSLCLHSAPVLSSEPASFFARGCSLCAFVSLSFLLHTVKSQSLTTLLCPALPPQSLHQSRPYKPQNAIRSHPRRCRDRAGRQCPQPRRTSCPPPRQARGRHRRRGRRGDRVGDRHGRRSSSSAYDPGTICGSDFAGS